MLLWIIWAIIFFINPIIAIGILLVFFLIKNMMKSSIIRKAGKEIIEDQIENYFNN